MLLSLLANMFLFLNKYYFIDGSGYGKYIILCFHISILSLFLFRQYALMPVRYFLVGSKFLKFGKSLPKFSIPEGTWTAILQAHSSLNTYYSLSQHHQYLTSTWYLLSSVYMWHTQITLHYYPLLWQSDLQHEAFARFFEWHVDNSPCMMLIVFRWLQK